MENPTEYLVKQHPDKSFDDGTLHMEHIMQAGFEQPRRFIWDRKLLTNASVKTLNIRAVIQALEQGLKIKDYLDLNVFLNPKDCQSDPTKLSYIVLKSVQAYPRLQELQQKADEDGVAEELAQLRQQLAKELQEYDSLKFKPYQVSVASMASEASQGNAESLNIQTATRNIAPQQIEEKPRSKPATTEQDNEIVQEQQREIQYQNWSKEQLIHYILMLEETNTALQKQAKEIKTTHDQFKWEMQPIAAQRDRELLVPNIVRSDQVKKGKFLGIW